MLNANVVRLAVEYLDQCNAAAEPPTLVGMHWFIDAQHKTLPVDEEVNEALRQRPNLRVIRTPEGVVFGPSGSDTAVSPEDMRLADNQYRRAFSAALKKLQDSDA